MMVAAGHKQDYAAGLVAAGSVIGPVIPPSIGSSSSAWWAASRYRSCSSPEFSWPAARGGLCVAWWWVAQAENLRRGQGSWRSREGLIDGFWALMLPVIIVVGCVRHLTPTEAGVVVAVYSLFVATCIYRELKLSDLYDVFVSAAVTTSVVMFLVAAALVSSWLITVAEIDSDRRTLKPFMGNKMLLMLAIMVIVVIVGTALDMTPTILILTPILMPWSGRPESTRFFGVVFIINNSIGLITPPVGVVLNVVAAFKHQHGRHHQGSMAISAGSAGGVPPAFGFVSLAGHRAS